MTISKCRQPCLFRGQKRKDFSHIFNKANAMPRSIHCPRCTSCGRLKRHNTVGYGPPSCSSPEILGARAALVVQGVDVGGATAAWH
eukprot:scaffold105999_cov32-Tisochrysis_lutea.AAC.2